MVNSIRTFFTGNIVGRWIYFTITSLVALMFWYLAGINYLEGDWVMFVLCAVCMLFEIDAAFKRFPLWQSK